MSNVKHSRQEITFDMGMHYFSSSEDRRSRHRRTRRPLVLWCCDLTLLILVDTCYEMVIHMLSERACVIYSDTGIGMFGDWHCGGCLAFIHRRSANVYKRRRREGGMRGHREKDWGGEGAGKQE